MRVIEQCPCGSDAEIGLPCPNCGALDGEPTPIPDLGVVEAAFVYPPFAPAETNGHASPELIAHIAEGIEDAKAGRVVDLGSFAEHVSDTDRPPRRKPSEIIRELAAKHLESSPKCGPFDVMRAELDQVLEWLDREEEGR